MNIPNIKSAKLTVEVGTVKAIYEWDYCIAVDAETVRRDAEIVSARRGGSISAQMSGAVTTAQMDASIRNAQKTGTA